MENQNIEFEIQYGHYKRFILSEVSLVNVESLTSSDSSYIERLEAIKNKQPKRLEEIANEINSLRKELSNVKNKPIKELLQNREMLEAPEQLIFFIMNGYIDENYPDYISLFFESSISRADKEYAMVVNGRQIPKFELELKNHSELLLNYLLEDEMSTDSVLNISMLSYLSQVNSFEGYKQNFLRKMCDKSDVSVEFLTLLFDKDVDFFDSLIPLLIKHDDTVFDEILEQENSEQTLSNYSKIIKHSGRFLKNGSYLAEKLSKFLSKRVDYIEYVKDSLEHGKVSFQDFSLRIEPKFKHLEASNLELFNWLGGQGFFSIETDIIKEILSCNLFLSSNEVEILLQDAPLTTVCNSGINYLVEDFWKNINEYVYLFTMYLKDEKQLHEDEDILIEILNEEALMSDSKERQLLVVATEINDICRVEETLHDKLFEYNVAKPTWGNIVQHFKNSNKKLSHNITYFINDNSDLLSINHTEHKEIFTGQEALQQDLESALIKCNDLDDEAYDRIVRISEYRWRNIDFAMLSESKVLMLIAHRKLYLSSNNWQRIVSFDKVIVRSAYIEEYIYSIIEGELLDELEASDYITIIENEKISKNEKQDFIEANIGKMLEILNVSAKSIIDIFDDKRLPDKLYENIKNTENEDYIQYLFMNHDKFLKNDEILALLPLMGSPFDDLNKNSKTKFDINEINLLDALYERKIIVLVKKVNKIIGNSYYESRLRKDL